MFTLTCSPYSPGTRQPAHTHEDLQITLVVRGSLEERVGAAVERATALSVVVKDPGVVHDDRFGSDGALTARLTLRRTVFADLVEHPRHALAWRWVHGGLVATPFLRIVRRGVSGDRQFAPDQDDILDIVAALSARLEVSTPRGRPGWLVDAVTGVHDGWRPGLTVRELARAAGVHPVYFARCVRRWYGVGAAEMLREARLRYAARHIADADPTIATVAHAAGFADESHLNREFAQVTGVPPARFRRLARAFEAQRPGPHSTANARGAQVSRIQVSAPTRAYRGGMMLTRRQTAGWTRTRARDGLLTAAAGLGLAAPPLQAQDGRASAAVIARAVDSLAARVVAEGVSPAFGVAVVMDGNTILAKSYGWADASARIPATDRTLWYLASTSKSFTGFGVSLLAQQGAVDFDASIASLLPGVQWADGVDPARLTLARFLSHTHGLNDNAVVQSAAFTGAIPEARWPQLIRYARPTGSNDLVYSNFGYNVAAMVIDRLRPEGWRRFLDSAVYTPAGMAETYARLSGLDLRRIAKPHRLNPGGGFTTLEFEKRDATMNSAGGHVATLRDLARWTIVQMDSGRIDGRQVFPPEAVALSHRLIARHTVPASRRFGPFDREGWAAGWDIGSYRGEPMVSRFGGYSSIRSHLSMLPRRRIGVVAQANGPGASSATDIVATLAYDLEVGRPHAVDSAHARLGALIVRLPAARERQAASDSVRRARQKPLRHPLAGFAGSYFNEAFGTITFSVRASRLTYRWGVLDGPVEVFDAAKDQLRFEIAGSGTVATFTFPAAGAATSVEIGGATFTRR